MNRYLKALPKAVIKKILADPVLIAAWVLAFVSMFFVHPDAGYSSYVDWRSLGILWGLMVVIQGFRDNTVFEKAGGFLLKKVRNGWQLAAVLVFLCFFAGIHAAGRYQRSCPISPSFSRRVRLEARVRLSSADISLTSMSV